jgi:hypothetical protein
MVRQVEIDNSVSQLGMAISVPSIAGRTQRVLINKRKGANPTSSAARLFKKPLQQSGHD